MLLIAYAALTTGVGAAVALIADSRIGETLARVMWAGLDPDEHNGNGLLPCDPPANERSAA